MAEDDPLKPGGADDLSTEVAVRANLDETGLTVAGKSRFLSAADRLFGGVLGWPAAYVEGLRRRAELQERTKDEAERIKATKALAALQDSDDFGKATAQRFIDQELRKQANVEAVWVETENALKALPSPDPTATASGDTTQELDADWLDVFTSYAEKANGERLRQMWGRILAGEIRKPTSFSPRTLRFVAELDAETAGAFQEVARLQINGRMVKPEKLQGETLDRLMLLEQSGLIEGALGSLIVTLNTQDETLRRFLIVHPHVLIVTAKSMEAEITYPMIQLTRVGQEIASILPSDPPEGLELVAKVLRGPIERIDLGWAVPGPDGTQLFRLDKCLKEPPRQEA